MLKHLVDKLLVVPVIWRQLLLALRSRCSRCVVVWYRGEPLATLGKRPIAGRWHIDIGRASLNLSGCGCRRVPGHPRHSEEVVEVDRRPCVRRAVLWEYDWRCTGDVRDSGQVERGKGGPGRSHDDLSILEKGRDLSVKMEGLRR